MVQKSGYNTGAFKFSVCFFFLNFGLVVDTIYSLAFMGMEDDASYVY